MIWMGRWDLGKAMSFLLFFGMTATRDHFHDRWWMPSRMEARTTKISWSGVAVATHFQT